MATIVIHQQGQRHERALSAAPVHIGRAPDNTLSLIDERLSWHHAVFWLEHGCAWVRDLASTNGTFVNGQRVRGATPIHPGDEVTLGGQVRVALRDSREAAPMLRFVLEDLRCGTRLTLEVGTLSTVAAQAASVDLPGPLTLDEDGGLSVAIGGKPHPFDLEELVSAPGGQRLRVVLLESLRVATVGLLAEPYPYTLSVALNAPGGREATLRNRQTGEVLRITAETRVFLLYLLARRVQEDHAAGRAPEDCGWCSEEELLTGIWGRGRGYASKLSVLVHRVRRDLASGGFSHDVLERGQKAIRARIIDIELR